MRNHVLALATSVAFVLACGGFEARAQQDPGYGPGWRDQQGGGYGRGRRDAQSGGYRRDERDEGYGQGRGDERGEGYGRGGRDQEGDGYRRGGREQRDEAYGRGPGGDDRERPAAMGGHFGTMGPGMMGPTMMRMMLVLMDTDGDGSVSLSEFRAAQERVFKALDANKDGRLTLQEVQAFFQGQNGMKAPERRPSQRDSSAPETRPAQPDGNSAH
jgi:hypothetical protein